ncbi:hypothetical protein PAPYR_1731 [Paratrimastix pyriformis]|uniref:EGF-like domain-containing protein n=1 Tax=Paratrimastix pyriformis TaxID=342808 RepID=A0ABQ8UR66_9EUKA|nr:hypothetical protein PAPYR_1731 [Paratrimastix pyriformis]
MGDTSGSGGTATPFREVALPEGCRIAQVYTNPAPRTFLRCVDGRLFAAGLNKDGALCLGTSVENSPFTQVTLPGGTLKSLVMGSEHTILLMDGSLYGCGLSAYYEVLFQALTIDRDVPLCRNQICIPIQFFIQPRFLCVPFGGWGGGGLTFQFGALLKSPQLTPRQLTPGPPGIVVQVCAMDHATVVLLSNGDLYGAGSNGDGRLGLGDAVISASGFTKIPLPTDRTATAIACAGGNLAAILDDGSLATCGSGDYSVLGDGTTTDRYTLSTVALPGRRKAASLQMSGTLFVRSVDGIISGTGWNTHGQLGLGTSSATSPITMLTDIPIPPGATPAWFTCGPCSTFVYTTDGRLLAAGFDSGGGLFTLTTGDDLLVLTESDLLTPQRGLLRGVAPGCGGTLAWGLAAPSPTGVSPATVYPGKAATLTLTGAHFRTGATAVAVGGLPCANVVVVNATCLQCTTDLPPGSHDVVVTNTDIGLNSTLKSAFTVVCFGVSSLSATVGRPGDVITATGCGFTATCRVQLGSTGTLQATTTFLSATSLQFVVPAQPSAAMVTYEVFVTETAAGMQSPSAEAPMFSYARGDALWVSGQNYNYWMGDTSTGTAFREIALPVGCRIAQVSTNPNVPRSFLHCVDGRLFAAGANSGGQLCLGTTTDAPFTQVTLPAGKTLKTVAPGAASTILHMTDVLVVSGLNVDVSSVLPLQLHCIFSLVHLTLPFVWESATVLLLDNGDLYGAGSNVDGRLGLGPSVSSATAFTKIALPTGRTAPAIKCSAWNLAAILDDGSVATCGYGADGVLGDGATTDRYTLGAAVLPGTGRRAASLQISAYTLFVRSTDGRCHLQPPPAFLSGTDTRLSGHLSGTGMNNFGQLGLGHAKPIKVLTDIPIPGGAAAVLFSSGLLTTFVSTSDGRLLASGLNDNGRLFTATPGDRLVLTESDLLTPQRAMLQGVVTSNLGSLAWGLSGGPIADRRSPATAEVGRAATLTLTGAHFRQEAVPAVRVGGLPCVSVVVLNASCLQCTTHPTLPLGSHDVVVTNTDIGLNTTRASAFTGSDALWASGENTAYWMGDTSTSTQPFHEVALPAGCRIAQVYTNPGKSRSFLRCVDGRLFAAGDNYGGALCLGTTTDAPFTQVTLPAGKILKAVAPGADATILHMTDVGDRAGLASADAAVDHARAARRPDGRPSVHHGRFALTSQLILFYFVQKSATALLLENGDVYGAGSNTNGRLGLGSSVTSASAFTKIALPTDRTATSITCTYYNLAAILDDGSVATCGSGGSGVNGDGTTADRYTLTTVALPGTGRRAASLQISAYTLFVRSTDGSISGAGLNTEGQLGLGHTTSPIPLLTDLPIPTGATTAWFAVGPDATFVYTTDGRLLVVGSGQFIATSGDLLVLTESTLMTTQRGKLQGAASTSTGSLTWGLAVPSLTGVAPARAEVSIPTTLTLTGAHFRAEATVVTVGGLPCANVVVASAASLQCTTDPALPSGSHDVVVTNTDIGLNATLTNAFTVVCFHVSSLSTPVGRPGDVINVTGCGFTATCRVQLGATGALLATTFLSATSIQFEVPAQPTTTVLDEVFVTETATGMQSPSTGATFSYARGDALWASGQNDYYWLGDTATGTAFREIALPAGCRIAQVFSNPTITRSFLHCVDGRLFAAGSNYGGQLCLGTTANAPLTQVTLPAGKTLKTVATSGLATILHMTDGSLYGCGNPYHREVLFVSLVFLGNCPLGGSLGTSLLAPQLTPLLLAPGLPASRTVAQVCAIVIPSPPWEYATVLLLDNGDMYGAGSNLDGRLGLGSSVTSASFFTKIALPAGRRATTIACSFWNLAAILDDGSVAACGSGYFGSIGDGTTTDRYTLTPVALPGTGRRAASLHLAQATFFVGSTEGITSGAGWNDRGQLGLGHTNYPIKALTDIPIPAGATVAWFAPGFTTTFAYTTDGRLLVAGQGDYGGLFMTTPGNRLVLTESDLLTPQRARLQGVAPFDTGTLAWGLAAPSLNGVSPSTAYAGRTVTLTGAHFRAEATVVTVGGLPCANAKLVDATCLQCTTDAALPLGSHDVVVTNTDIGLNATLTSAFAVGCFRVSSLSASVGRPGDVITVTGCGFTATCRVQLGTGGALLATTFLSATSLRFVVPAQPSAAIGAAYEVLVTETATGDQAPSTGVAWFGYPPTVSGLSVLHGPAGSTTAVTVTGTNFAGGAAVRLGTGAAHIDVTPSGAPSSNSLTFVVPTQASAESQLGSRHSGQWAVAVVNPASAGSGLSAETGPGLTFSYQPAVTGVSPAWVARTAASTNVTVTGRNLYSGAAVHLAVAAVGGGGSGTAPPGGDITPTSIAPSEDALTFDLPAPASGVADLLEVHVSMPAALMGGTGGGAVYSPQTAVTIHFYTPPAVVAVSALSSNAHSPLLAKVGDQVTVTFTANVALDDMSPSALPVVTLAGRGAAVAFVGAGATTFTAVLAMTSGNTQGNLTFALSSMRDPQGNLQTEATITGTTDVVFDSVAPRLAAVTGASSSGVAGFARVGDQVTLTLQADEALDDAAATLPGVMLAGRAAAVQLVGAATVRATVTLLVGPWAHRLHPERIPLRPGRQLQQLPGPRQRADRHHIRHSFPPRLPFAAEASAARSNLTFARQGTAGTWQPVLIRASDPDGNPVPCTATCAGTAFALELSSAQAGLGAVGVPLAPVEWSCLGTDFLANYSAPLVAASDYILWCVDLIGPRERAPWGLVVTPDSISAAHCHMTVPASTAGLTVGIPCTSTFTARDRWGNHIPCTNATANATFVLLLDEAAPANLTWTCTGGGDFAGTFTPMAPFGHTLKGATRASGEPVGEEATITVEPAPVDGAQSFVSTNSTVVVAGHLLAVSIVARDAYGRSGVVCTAANVNATFALLWDGCAPEDLSWGCRAVATEAGGPAWVGTFRPVVAGPHLLAVVALSDGAFLTSGGTQPSNLTVTVTEGPMAASQATLVVLGDGGGSGPMAVGTPITLGLTARDAWRNPIGCVNDTASRLRVTVDGSSSSSLVAGLVWRCSGDGATFVSSTWTPTRGDAGRRTISVLMCDGPSETGEDLVASVNVTITGVPTAADSTFTLNPSNPAAGSQLRVVIRARDPAGTEFGCTPETANTTFAVLLDGSVAPGGDGGADAVMWACLEYEEPASFVAVLAVPTSAGAHNVSVTLDGQPISGSATGQPMVVTAAVVSAVRSSLVAPASTPAGAAYTVTVTARDAAGNVVPCSGPKAATTFRLLWDGAALTSGLTWSCTGSPATATFAATFAPTAAGPHTVALTYGGQRLGAEAPAIVTISPGAVSGEHSRVAVEPSDVVVAGRPVRATFTACDPFGNTIACAAATVGSTFAVGWGDGSGVATAPPGLVWACNGSAFAATFSPTASGLHLLEATLAPIGGAPVGGDASSGGGHPIRVVPASPSALQSNFTTAAMSTAGAVLSATVTGRDPYSNAVPCTAESAGTTFGLLWDGRAIGTSATPATSWSCLAEAGAPTLFVGTFTPTVAGPHTLAVTVGGMPLEGGGAGAVVVAILPGPASAATSAVASSSLSASEWQLVPGRTAWVALAALGNPISCTEATANATFVLTLDGSPWGGDGGAADGGGRVGWACSAAGQQPAASSLFVGTFSCTAADVGSHIVEVLLLAGGGSALASQGGRFNITVTGPAAASHSTVRVSNSTVPAGSLVQATFTARDAAGTVVGCTEATANATFAVRWWWGGGAERPAPAADVVWSCSADRPALFVATLCACPSDGHDATGTGQLSVVMAGSGEPLANVTVTLTPAVVSAARSSFVAPESSPAGATYTVTATARDEAGNVVPCSGGPTAASTFRLLWDGAPVAAGLSWSCTGSNPAAATFAPTAAGPHTVAVTYGGQVLGTAVRHVTVTPEPPSPAQSTFAALSATVMAGAAVHVTFTARDRYGNTVPCNPGAVATAGVPFAVFLDGLAPPGLAWRCSADSPARILATWLAPLQPGSYAITASCGGVSVTSGPSTVTVLSDTTPPTFAAGSVIFTSDNPNGPTRARLGDRLSLRFAASDPLGAATVLIAGHTLAAAQLDQAATEWGASWVVRSSDCAAEGGGPRLLGAAVVNATDRAGNPLPSGTTPVAASATVELDCTWPRLSRLTFTSSNVLARVAQPGDLVTVRFTATEPLRVTASSPIGLTIAGHPVTVTAAAAANDADGWTSFEASYQLTGADSLGPVGFTVLTLADLAGNTLEAPLSTPTEGPAVIYFGLLFVFVSRRSWSTCTLGADCGTKGECLPVAAGLFGCRCPLGSSGARCEAVEGSCTVDGDCHNGGSCQGAAPSKACACPSAWTGDHCDTPVAEVFRCHTDADCQSGGDSEARCLAGGPSSAVRLWECQCSRTDYAVTNTPLGGTTCGQRSDASSSGLLVACVAGPLGGLLFVAGLVMLLLVKCRDRRRGKNRPLSCDGSRKVIDNSQQELTVIGPGEAKKVICSELSDSAPGVKPSDLSVQSCFREEEKRIGENPGGTIYPLSLIRNLQSSALLTHAENPWQRGGREGGSPVSCHAPS